MQKRLIPIYSIEEFNQAQRELIKEGYSWWNDNNEPINPIRTDVYPIFIVITTKKTNLTWCPLEYVKLYFKKKWRVIKLEKIKSVQKGL